MTTDTALLVSREILEEARDLDKLNFITDPEIPTDNQVKRYLDLRLPLQSLIDDTYKLSELPSLSKFREEAANDVKEFDKAMRMRVD